MVNIWNPYQCMVTFNLSRSMSSFESGIGRGMGFRDSSQDLFGCSERVPDRARQRILDLAATQLARAAPTTSTSRSPSAATTRWAPDSTTTRSGSSSPSAPTSRRPGTSASSTSPSRTTTSRNRDTALRAPAALRALQARPARAARAAAHRPRRLERLPQPQLLLRDPGRVVPDHREQGGRRRRVGVHRRPVRPGGEGARRDRAARRPRRRGRVVRGRGGHHGRSDRGARLGRRVVPARLRLLRQRRRLGTQPRGADLHRVTRHVRHGRHRCGGRQGRARRSQP